MTNNQEQNSKIQKILIVEDEQYIRELLVLKLNLVGFETTTAIEGKEALRKIEEETPSLVLLDLILPGIDGFEVLEKMKNNPSTARIPVIILSNLGQKEEIDKGLKLGADDYLIKANFTPNQIIERVREILKKV